MNSEIIDMLSDCTVTVRYMQRLELQTILISQARAQTDTAQNLVGVSGTQPGKQLSAPREARGT